MFDFWTKVKAIFLGGLPYVQLSSSLPVRDRNAEILAKLFDVALLCDDGHCCTSLHSQISLG